MNYLKLTAGLSKEEFQAIYDNWLNRYMKLADEYEGIFGGWKDPKAKKIAYKLAVRIRALEIHLKVYFP